MKPILLIEIESRLTNICVKVIYEVLLMHGLFNINN